MVECAILFETDRFVRSVDALSSASDVTTSLWHICTNDDVSTAAEHLSTDHNFVVILADSSEMSARIIHQV